MKRARGDNDIKALDGMLLGGLRRVRKNGTVLFQRGYWQCPLSWAGQDIWVHDWVSLHDSSTGVEAWPPGARVYSRDVETLILHRTDRRDAKPGYRDPAHIAWHKRNAA